MFTITDTLNGCLLKLVGVYYRKYFPRAKIVLPTVLYFHYLFSHYAIDMHIFSTVCNDINGCSDRSYSISGYVTASVSTILIGANNCEIVLESVVSKHLSVVSKRLSVVSKHLSVVSKYLFMLSDVSPMSNQDFEKDDDSNGHIDYIVATAVS